MLKKVAVLSILSLFTLVACQTQGTNNPNTQNSSTPSTEKVEFSKVKEVITQKCTVCHASPDNRTVMKGSPTAGGVLFETPEQMKAKAERIKARAVIAKSMPMGNAVTISDQERELLGKWVDSGASIQ
ncbi:MAG: hypothetical protein U0457_00495 [Candidatus Sericytochromatia bacterium]